MLPTVSDSFIIHNNYYLLELIDKMSIDQMFIVEFFFFDKPVELINLLLFRKKNMYGTYPVLFAVNTYLWSFDSNLIFLESGTRALP